MNPVSSLNCFRMISFKVVASATKKQHSFISTIHMLNGTCCFLSCSCCSFAFFPGLAVLSLFDIYCFLSLVTIGLFCRVEALLRSSTERIHPLSLSLSLYFLLEITIIFINYDDDSDDDNDNNCNSTLFL